MKPIAGIMSLRHSFELDLFGIGANLTNLKNFKDYYNLKVPELEGMCYSYYGNAMGHWQCLPLSIVHG